MEFGDFAELHGDRSSDRQYATEVNYMLRTGIVVLPQPWAKDMKKQRDERLDYMSKSEYRNLDEETQSKFQLNLAYLEFYIACTESGIPWWKMMKLPEDLFPEDPAIYIARQQAEVQAESQAAQQAAMAAVAPPQQPEQAMQEPQQAQQPQFEMPQQLDGFGMAPEEQAAAMASMVSAQVAESMPGQNAPVMEPPVPQPYNAVLNTPAGTSNVVGSGDSDFASPL